MRDYYIISARRLLIETVIKRTRKVANIKEEKLKKTGDAKVALEL